MARKQAGKVDPRATTEFDAHIGARIRARRLEMGMSQGALAQELGVTFQQIQKYEKGANRIAARTLWRVAQILKTDYKSIFPELSSGRSESVLNSTDFAELGALYAKLNPRGRRVLLANARSFVDEPELAEKKGAKG